MAKKKITVRVDGDSSGLERSLKRSKQSLKDFDRSAKEALGGLGDLFGVNTQKVQQLSSAVQGMGAKLEKSGKAGAAALGKIVTAAGAAGTALGALGLGAAVASFKLLNAEAENFKSTVQGAGIALSTEAYVSTYRQVMHDMVSTTGKSMAEFEAMLSKKWAGFKSTLANVGVGLLSGEGLGGSIAGALAGSALAGQQGERAAEIAKGIYGIQRQQSDNLIRIAELDAQIAAQAEIYRDTMKDASEREAAIVRARALINEKYSLQLPLAQKLADYAKEMADLASSTPEQIDAANNLRVAAIRLEQQQAQELTTLLRTEGSVTRELQKQAEAAAAIAQSRADLSSLNLSTGGIPTGRAEALGTPGLAGAEDRKVMPVDLQKTNFTQTVLQGAEAASTAIGELIGDLATGGDAWGNFANTALSAFADMAISIGKLTIATGVASEGIKKALRLSPKMALVAGASLIALGAAVKAGLSNIASGAGSSASVAVASSGYSSAGADFGARAMQVDIRGDFEVRGDKLIAAIRNTEKKTRLTT